MITTGDPCRLSRLSLAAYATVLLWNPAWAADAQISGRVIAVARFEYLDTSGEVRDQRNEHESRLKAFLAALREDLAATGKYGVVSLSCEGTSCSASDDPSQLLEQGRRSGADVVIFGGIHKLSSLIQWMKVTALDVETKTVVFERLLSFRGDSDEAWRRSEKFLAQDLASAPLTK
jgi:hypothetical protein